MEIDCFLSEAYHKTQNSADPFGNKLKQINDFIDQKLKENWEFSLDIKIPYLIIPEFGSLKS